MDKNENDQPTEHLSAGAYVSLDEMGDIWLTANTHRYWTKSFPAGGCSDRVCLDRQAIINLERFIAQLREEGKLDK